MIFLKLQKVSEAVKYPRYNWGGNNDENPFQDYLPDQLRDDPKKKEKGIDGPNKQHGLGIRSRDKSPGGIYLALQHLGYMPFYNTRSMVFEYSKDGMSHRKMIDKEVEAYLRGLIRANFSFINTKRKTKNNTLGTEEPLHLGRDEFFDALYAICAHHSDKCKGDPFQQFYQGLPVWDGVSRIDGFIDRFFSVDQDYLQVSRWASRFLFLGPIHRAENPGAKLDTAPILAGDSHLGKSTIIHLIFPEAYRTDWFTDDFSLISRDSGKDQIESTLGSVIVEISEMVGYRKADIDTLKAMLSRRVDKKRLAYRRDVDKIPRRFIFVGTSNDMNCIPNDPSNALKRRLPVIPVYSRGMKLADLKSGINEIRDQLWAEAWSRFKKGEAAALIGDLEQEVIALGENHRMADDETENKLKRYEKDLPAGYVFKSLNEIAAGLGLIENLGNEIVPSYSVSMNFHVQKSLTTALRNSGWTNVRKMIDGVKTRGWEIFINRDESEETNDDSEYPF